MQVRLLIEMSLFSTEAGSHPGPDPKHREHAQYSYGRESVHVHADNSFYTPLSGQTAVFGVIHDTATISENDSFQSESSRDSSSGYWLGVTYGQTDSMLTAADALSSNKTLSAFPSTLRRGSTIRLSIETAINISALNQKKFQPFADSFSLFN